MSDHLTALANLGTQEYKECGDCNRSFCMEAFSYPRVNYARHEVKPIGWVLTCFGTVEIANPRRARELSNRAEDLHAVSQRGSTLSTT